jgi:hypothetical protein
MTTTKETYSAVVESGSCSTDYTRWEERMNCGHAHKTEEAARKCGEKNYDAKYVNGSWQASAAWHGYTVHNQNGERLTGPTEPGYCVECGKDVADAVGMAMCPTCEAKFAAK